MKKVLCMIIVCILFTGCGKNGYQTISASKAKEMMNENTVVLDVRTKTEYEMNHIENAINIPLDEIDQVALEKLKDKNQTILVYCQSGARSKQASQKLVDLGYTEVYNFGGLNQWNYETASPKKDSTKLLLKQVISAVKMAYLDAEMNGSIVLPLEIICDGKTCLYGDNQILDLAGSMIPEGTILLESNGNVKANDIVLNGYHCHIGEKEKITCE